jgi:hypothetical protein
MLKLFLPASKLIAFVSLLAFFLVGGYFFITQSCAPCAECEECLECEGVEVQEISEDLEDLEISGSPKRSVQKFVNDVLVDPPFDYEAAGEYLIPSLHDRFDNESGFVPLTLGIQDHPGSVTVNDAEMFDDSAIVRVIGHYDGTQLEWDFTVVVYEDEWKISEIEKAF